MAGRGRRSVPARDARMRRIKIELIGGETYTGTPLQVLNDMMGRSPFTWDLSPEESIARIVSGARTYHGVKLLAEGATLEERVGCLIDSMAEHGLAVVEEVG